MSTLKEKLKFLPGLLAAELTTKVEEIGEKVIHEFTLALRDASLEEITEAREAGKPKRRKSKKTKKGARRGARGGRKGARKSGKKPARLPRRSPEQIAKVVKRVANLIKKNGEGMRSEQIRTKLRLDKREVPRVMREAVSGGAVVILSGQKRSTTYGVVSKKKAAKRAAAKKTVAKKPAAKK
jgi:hypothetical protein